MIHNDTATAIVTDNKGETLVLKLTDGTYVGGIAISVNSKGVNLKDTGGHVFTKALSKITAIMTETQYADEIDPQGDDLGEYADSADNDEDFEEGDSTRELEESREDDTDYSDEDELTEDDEDEDSADGMSAAEVAAIFDMPAKDLRKVTRSMGLGVGRGRVYSFDVDDVKAIRQELKVRAAGGIDDATS